MNQSHKSQEGFTLIEVLLALTVIAIALTALLKSTAQTIRNTQRLKEKTISHWVAMQGVAMIQSGLLVIKPNQDVTKITTLFNQRWYWRVTLTKTTIKHLQKITITTSTHASGPYTNPVIAWQYQS